jgi:hypothetical protein
LMNSEINEITYISKILSRPFFPIYWCHAINRKCHNVIDKSDNFENTQNQIYDSHTATGWFFLKKNTEKYRLFFVRMRHKSCQLNQKWRLIVRRFTWINKFILVSLTKSCDEFKIDGRSAQTHKSISFIWIVWSTLSICTISLGSA